MLTKGIMMFNRGSKMTIGALVSLYSLRKFYDGNITFYVEEDYPHELDEALKYFGCDIVHNETRHDFKTLVRKNSLFENPPYDLTLWLDIDIVVVGKIDKMFDYLEEKNVDLCIPSFCGWVNSGSHMVKRINRFNGIIDDKYIKKAVGDYLSVNTGVLSFRKSDKWSKFVHDWTVMADLGAKQSIFIPDETVANILIPSIEDWGLKCFICETNFNVSPIHDHGRSKDPRIFHFHGDKSVLPVPSCDIFKKEFEEMRSSNIANINSFLKYADKRLGKYLRGEPVWGKDEKKNIDSGSDITFVTACDSYYVDILRETFPNWVKYKQINKYPIIIFYNGMAESDSRLDFLRLPNVTLIPWSKEVDLDNVIDHREEMLSSFVFGPPKYVKTEYWVKLDADSYATDYRPLITEEMKKFSLFSHKWGYSRPDHIKKLDEWARGHWKRKLRLSKPMIEQGRIEGNRFYHNNKRIISYVCLQKTRFTKFCVKLLKERKLPAPTQDSYAYFILMKFDPSAMGIGNFKRDHGFTQGKGKMGVDYFIKRLKEVDDTNAGKTPIPIDSQDEDYKDKEEDDFCGENEKTEESVQIRNRVLPSTMIQFPAIPDGRLINYKPVEKFPAVSRCPEGENFIVEIRESR